MLEHLNEPPSFVMQKLQNVALSNLLQPSSRWRRWWAWPHAFTRDQFLATRVTSVAHER